MLVGVMAAVVLNAVIAPLHTRRAKRKQSRAETPTLPPRVRGEFFAGLWLVMRWDDIPIQMGWMIMG